MDPKNIPQNLRLRFITGYIHEILRCHQGYYLIAYDLCLSKFTATKSIFVFEKEKAIVDEQYETFDRNHERHFLDMYFKKIEDTQNDPNSTYSCESS